MPSKKKAIGIDLGTTFTCVAVVKSDTKVDVICNRYGNNITPSVVHFSSTGKVVGEEAQANRAADPKNAIYHVKRFMGKYSGNAETTARDYDFEILSSRRGDMIFRVTPSDEEATGDSMTYSPEQVSFYILRYMKNLAEVKIENEVKDAVITVPANFNSAQRQATKDAGEMAGLNVLRIIPEPTAAALAYGFGLNSETAKTVLVYDLGGGTFDVSIVHCKGLKCNVLSTAGDSFLGGEDFDMRLYKHACAEFTKRGLEIADNEKFGLKRSCEEAKKNLSVCDRAVIELSKNGTIHTCEITREDFENLCIDLFEKTMDFVRKAIEEAKIRKEAIDDIVLVGGSSRIPLIKQIVGEFFGDKELNFNIPPDNAVAVGAAILAESLSSNTDSECSSIRGAVALADVLSHSLGIGLTCDRFSVILSRNTRYPASNTHVYENAEDNLTSLDFKILEGESALSSENTQLGLCKIPVPKKNIGENIIVTTFAVDEDGILSVHLRDKDTNKEASTKVQTSKYTDEERMNMVRDARKEDEDEKSEKEKFEARSAFAKSIDNIRRSVHRTDIKKKKSQLQKLAETEEKWLKSQKNPSNGEILARASSNNEKLAKIMK